MNLKDQLTQVTYKLVMNKFEEDLSNQALKLERLATINKELRAKVDNFIGLIQNLSIL
jgi:hypothetical protein